jgi:hypothetical protein
MKAKRVLFVTILCSVTVFVATGVCSEIGKPILREETKVIVDGIEERWRFEWINPPVSVCGPEDEDWVSCPCTGFAYGERGDLDLVRKRPGHKEERFSLTQLFEGYGDNAWPQALLRRWDTEKNDIDNYKLPDFVSRVKARPLAKIMRFGDYDHDGRATEFVLQIGTLPCGKKMSVVVGVSRQNKQLHAFSGVKNLERPLILQTFQWESLLSAKGPIKVINWKCGDHGSDREEELELRAQDGNIYAIRKTYECTDNGRRGRLIGREDF